jgi:YidC/Oxa1 family membrane protein insertase
MEKRVLLAVVLSFLVLYTYQALFPPPRPEPPATTPAPETPAPAAVEAPAVAAPPPAPVPDAPAEVAETLVADTEERDIVVENDHVRATFSTRGAVLTSWRLKRYLSEDDLLDIVPEHAPAGSPRPFSLAFDDPALGRRLTQALFRPDHAALDTTASPGSLTFEFKDAAGLSARKVFTFEPAQPYLIRFTAEVTSGGAPLNPIVHWGPALGTGIVTSGLTYSPSSQPIFYRDGDVNRIGFGDVQQYRVLDGQTGFAGVDDHYFMAAVLPGGQPVRLHYEPMPVTVMGEDRARQFVGWSVTFQAPPREATFFVGPKDFDVLAGVERDLVRAIHFGVFSPLVVPLLRALKWVNGYVGNYGWSIVILTIIINLVMFPLRHKSVVSMRKMQEIQPEMKAIQDRYAKLKMSDPARQKMNVELMNLYRERGVNPASGCVPMLLTLPVLFSFYSMLSVAIELRGAPFVLWIRDLSRYDPWFVTPVVMGATQFLQTKLTPTSMDPAQQRIMLLMPLIFMTMFIWAPSGLVLYWTVSNMWAIGQQVVTNRIIGPPPQRSVRPPAERRVKQAGSGKTAAAKDAGTGKAAAAKERKG